MTRAPTFPSGWSITVKTAGGRVYRLFRRAGKARWKCRVCGETVGKDYLERHRAVELFGAGSEDALASKLAIVALRRRKDAWRAKTQYYHEKARKESNVELDP